MVHIYSGILLNHRKEEILPFVTTWMDLEGTMLSEISQTEKDKYYVTSLVCGIKRNSQRLDLLLPKLGHRVEKKLDQGGQKVQTSSYKIKKHQGYNVQFDDYT